VLALVFLIAFESTDCWTLYWLLSALSLLIIGSAHYTYAYSVYIIRIHSFLWTKEMLVLCNCVLRLIPKKNPNQTNASSFYLPRAIQQTRWYTAELKLQFSTLNVFLW
jgi:hypothetical protein